MYYAVKLNVSYVKKSSTGNQSDCEEQMLQPSTQERFCLVVFVDETKHFSITVKTVGVQIYQELRFTVSQYDKSN